MSKKLHMIVVSITPFDEKGRLDEGALRKHLRRLGDAGCSVFLGSSASGEGYALSPEERDRLIAIGVEELKGKVSVRAMGCEPRVPREMVEFVRSVEKLKPDAVQIFSLDIGHGIKPTVGEMEKYYSDIIETTSMPVVLSSHQQSSNYLLALDMVERLLDRFPHIIGVNCGTNNLLYLSELIRRFKDRVEVHCAGPVNGLFVLDLGGTGFMGSEGNFAPVLTASVIKAFEAGDRDGVRESFGKLLAFAEINDRLGDGSALRGMKPLLNAFGLPGGFLRPPRQPASPEVIAKMAKAVLALRIPGIPTRLAA